MALSLWNELGRTGVSAVPSLPAQERGLSLHFPIVIVSELVHRGFVGFLQQLLHMFLRIYSKAFHC